MPVAGLLISGKMAVSGEWGKGRQKEERTEAGTERGSRK